MEMLTDPAQLADITKNMDRPTTLIHILCPGLEVQVEHRVERRGGREYPCVLTRLYGFATYMDQGVEVRATEASFSDFGRRQGVARGFTLAKGEEAAPEQSAAGRRQMVEVATKCLIDQGVW